MSEKQLITPKDLADAFEMKVIELSRFTGYSKQALYQMLDGTNGCCSSRMLATIGLLELKSKEMLLSDLREAMEKAEKRKNVLVSLKDCLGLTEY